MDFSLFIPSRFCFFERGEFRRFEDHSMHPVDAKMQSRSLHPRDWQEDRDDDRHDRDDDDLRHDRDDDLEEEDGDSDDDDPSNPESPWDSFQEGGIKDNTRFRDTDYEGYHDYVGNRQRVVQLRAERAEALQKAQNGVTFQGRVNPYENICEKTPPAREVLEKAQSLHQVALSLESDGHFDFLTFVMNQKPDDRRRFVGLGNQYDAFLKMARNLVVHREHLSTVREFGDESGVTERISILAEAQRITRELQRMQQEGPRSRTLSAYARPDVGPHGEYRLAVDRNLIAERFGGQVSFKDSVLARQLAFRIKNVVSEDDVSDVLKVARHLIADVDHHTNHAGEQYLRHGERPSVTRSGTIRPPVDAVQARVLRDVMQAAPTLVPREISAMMERAAQSAPARSFSNPQPVHSPVSPSLSDRTSGITPAIAHAPDDTPLPPHEPEQKASSWFSRLGGGIANAAKSAATGASHIASNAYSTAKKTASSWWEKTKAGASKVSNAFFG